MRQKIFACLVLFSMIATTSSFAHSPPTAEKTFSCDNYNNVAFVAILCSAGLELQGSAFADQVFFNENPSAIPSIAISFSQLDKSSEVEKIDYGTKANSLNYTKYATSNYRPYYTSEKIADILFVQKWRYYQHYRSVQFEGLRNISTAISIPTIQVNADFKVGWNC